MSLLRLVARSRANFFVDYRSDRSEDHLPATVTWPGNTVTVHNKSRVNGLADPAEGTTISVKAYGFEREVKYRPGANVFVWLYGTNMVVTHN
jgi:hypothetical protein